MAHVLSMAIIMLQDYHDQLKWKFIYNIIFSCFSYSEGLGFLNRTHPGLPTLPEHTFIAAEALAWIKQNVDGVESSWDAITLLQV